MSKMVDRFLCWKLPEDFGPDCGISFDRKTVTAHKVWPIGTNLLAADQARQMLAEVAMPDVAMLRAALVGLIGADGEQDLRQMEATMRLLPAPEADKAVSINAIHALLATMEA